ncbi:LuxR C-terminal-related transcriptional regulator [Tsuneonella sp. HG222]
MSDSPSVVDLRSACMRSLQYLGITRAWFIAPLTGDPRVGRILFNIGFSPVWERKYRSCLHLIDPLPDLSLRRTGSFAWPDAFAGEDLDPRQLRYLRMAERFGLASGVGTACFGPYGRCGFLGAERPADGIVDDIFLVRFNMIGQLSFQRYCALIRPEDEIQPLSNRELEVLQWIAFGKSNTVIADLLEISPSSVDVYVRRIFAKLGVSDRTTASVKAFSLGLVVAADHQALIDDAAKRA